MATTPPFKYQPMFEKGKDTTEYYLLTKDYVSVSEFEGKPILKIEKRRLDCNGQCQLSVTFRSCCVVRTTSRLLKF